MKLLSGEWHRTLLMRGHWFGSDNGLVPSGDRPFSSDTRARNSTTYLWKFYHHCWLYRLLLWQHWCLLYLQSWHHDNSLFPFRDICQGSWTWDLRFLCNHQITIVAIRDCQALTTVDGSLQGSNFRSLGVTGWKTESDKETITLDVLG